jgi:hemoglobin
MEPTLFERLGESTIHQLVDDFYELVFTDPTIGPLFKTDKELIKEKQRLFLTQFLGGPPLYSEQYGHPRLRARHLPHSITPKGAEAWLSCMSIAITKLHLDEALKDELLKRFVQTAFFMVNKEN